MKTVALVWYLFIHNGSWMSCVPGYFENQGDCQTAADLANTKSDNWEASCTPGVRGQFQ